MKKFIVLGAFLLIAPKFYSQTNSNYQNGYSQGYLAVTKQLPEVVPNNKDTTQKFSNSWATKYNDQPQSLSLRSIARDGDQDSNLEVYAYQRGFAKGKYDGNQDLNDKSSTSDDKKKEIKK